MLAASLLGETSIATPSSVTKESLTHSFAEVSLVSLYFWSRDPNFVSFLKYSLRHRKCGVRGFMHELFVSKTRTSEERASEGF